MTPPAIQSLTDITNRISRGFSAILSTGDPADECAPAGRTIVGLRLDLRQRTALDGDGLANDFIGAGQVIVREQTGHCGLFGDAQSRFFTGTFTYFIKENGALALRGLNPGQPISLTNLVAVPAVRAGFTRTGMTYRPANFQDAQDFAREQAAERSVTVFLGNIDARPGNEVEFISRGLESLGTANLAEILSGMSGS